MVPWTVIGFLLVLLVAGASVTAWLIYDRLLEPLRELERVSRQLVEGGRPSFVPRRGGKAVRALLSRLEELADEQARLKKKLIEENFNLRTILSSMKEGVMVLDRQHVIQLVN